VFAFPESIFMLDLLPTKQRVIDRKVREQCSSAIRYLLKPRRSPQTPALEVLTILNIIQLQARVTVLGTLRWKPPINWAALNPNVLRGELWAPRDKARPRTLSGKETWII
jgi:hypothetical protein